jgi:DNA-binding protein HU-beta
MHKSYAIKQIAKETRLTQRVVADVLEASHQVIEAELRKGGRIVFPGFGTFATSKRKGGTVKDIRTGKPVEYPARTVAVFKTGEVLKRAVAGKRRRRRWKVLP